MALNQLSEKHLRIADRMLATLLGLWGYICGLALVVDTEGWNDPVFTVVHKTSGGLLTWGIILLVSITVYVSGELLSTHYPHRGQIIIFGSTLCMFWHLAMSLSMARMVYIAPSRITILWPIVIFIIATVYAARVVIYSNIFQGRRWNTNPYQLWGTVALAAISTMQVVIGVAPGTVFTEIERPVQLTVAAANLIGACVVLVGLHLRNKEVGSQLELLGAVTLVATLAWYCLNVLARQPLASTTLGFGLTEAFVLATLHRSVQIALLNWARWTDRPRLEKRILDALHPPTTDTLVVNRDDLATLSAIRTRGVSETQDG